MYKPKMTEAYVAPPETRVWVGMDTVLKRRLTILQKEMMAEAGHRVSLSGVVRALVEQGLDQLGITDRKPLLLPKKRVKASSPTESTDSSLTKETESCPKDSTIGAFLQKSARS